MLSSLLHHRPPQAPRYCTGCQGISAGVRELPPAFLGPGPPGGASSATSPPGRKGPGGLHRVCITAVIEPALPGDVSVKNTPRL